MGRPKDPTSRRSKAANRRAKRAEEAAARLAQRGEPNLRVQERRQAFAFVKAEKGGMIDRDIHDAIGQLHALGLLDGHGHEAKDLRDVGRDYAELYWERYALTAPSVGSLEPRSRSTGDPPPRNARYDRFDRLDNSLTRCSMERTAIYMLLINHFHSDAMEGWVSRLINGSRLGHDKYMLGCAIRGLNLLMDASLPQRHARAA